MWEVDAIQRKAYTKKYCLAPDSGDSVCSGGIVKAHSVQGALLRKIARDGHVYYSEPSLQNIDKYPGQITFTLTGVNLATTFTGFCNLHDTKIFAAIENQPFVTRPEQCFLLSYRAVCRELFVKRAAVENAEWLVKNAPSHNLRFAEANLIGVRTGLRDIQWHKDAYDRDLRGGNFGAIEWVSIELANTPDF